jgi:hypothetical protein
MSGSHDCNQVHQPNGSSSSSSSSSSSGTSCNSSVDSGNWDDGMLRHFSNSLMYATDVMVANEEAIVPRPEDVLLGRGTKHQRHPGNIRYTGTKKQAATASLRVTLTHILVLFSNYI